MYVKDILRIYIYLHIYYRTLLMLPRGGREMRRLSGVFYVENANAGKISRTDTYRRKKLI